MLLLPELVEVDVVVSDWKEAIRESARLLYSKGYFEESYIDRMINSVLEFGPYIVLFPGFALAHASPGDDIHKTGLSLITLKTPINFGHEDHDPVKIVACLSPKDSNSHLELLSVLAEKLSNEEIVSKLMSVDSVDSLLKLINE